MELEEIVSARLNACVEEGHILFDMKDGDFSVVDGGVWVPCRIFVPNSEIE